MDTCHYCGCTYHPMPVYTKPGARIHVCHGRPRLNEDGELVWDPTDCAERAKAEGYVYRRDLTPKR